LAQKIAIIADQDVPIKRAERQDYLAESKSKMAILDHDMKAVCWTRFLHDRDPYHPDLFELQSSVMSGRICLARSLIAF
jgi:hypothetical protein